MQVIKQSALYDDGGGASGAGRELRDQIGPRHGGGGGGGAAGGHDGDGGGYGGGSSIDAALEHMINSRAMRGEYDLPLELLLPEGVKGGGMSGPPH